MTLVQRAVAIATELHEGQFRKGATPPLPYITHPLEVMALVKKHGGTEVEQAGAVCHDTAEDAGGQPVLDRLTRELGADVAAIVRGCSDCVVPKDAPKAPWKERKDAYLAHLRAEESRSTLLVSCADKLANASAILRDLRDPTVGAAVWERFTAGKDAQLWYYASLAAIFADRLPGPLATQLGAVVADVHALAA